MPMYAERKSRTSQHVETAFWATQHTSDVPILVVLSDKYIETVEDDDDGKVDECEVGGVRLETALEHQSVAVYTLGIQGMVELDVCHANRAPSEQACDCGQVLEPVEDD